MNTQDYTAASEPFDRDQEDTIAQERKGRDVKGQGRIEVECPSCGETLAIEVHLSEPIAGLTITDGDGKKKLLVNVAWDPLHHFCRGDSISLTPERA